MDYIAEADKLREKYDRELLDILAALWSGSAFNCKDIARAAAQQRRLWAALTMDGFFVGPLRLRKCEPALSRRNQIGIYFWLLCLIGEGAGGRRLRLEPGGRFRFVEAEAWDGLPA